MALNQKHENAPNKSSKKRKMTFCGIYSMSGPMIPILVPNHTGKLILKLLKEYML